MNQTKHVVVSHLLPSDFTDITSSLSAVYLCAIWVESFIPQWEMCHFFARLFVLLIYFVKPLSLLAPGGIKTASLLPR